jgi:hypothetical protein
MKLMRWIRILRLKLYDTGAKGVRTVFALFVMAFSRGFLMNVISVCLLIQ